MAGRGKRVILTGIPAADRIIRTLADPRTSNAIVTQELREAQKELKKEVVAEAPAGESGQLKKSFKVRVARKKGMARHKQAIALFSSTKTLKPKRQPPKGTGWASPTMGVSGGAKAKRPPFYAAAQEFGTGRMPGKHYMRRAFDRSGRGIVADAQRRILARLLAAAAAGKVPAPPAAGEG